ncbi:MAG: cation:proton antiporter [Dysgonamonadaceae bacterium]|jgi:Kef-type K+ transport system membrane component KefB|nr:cation:proton antiporter [Dysgonamonadaceae bacterium]
MPKKTGNICFYLTMLAVAGVLMYFTVKAGESRQGCGVAVAGRVPSDLGEGFHFFGQQLLEHLQSPFGILLLQIAVILACCRIFAKIFKTLRQPTVIGEILAGIVLGPSILGHWFPEVSGFLFPPESLGNIELLSQFGLILFMFAIGMELNFSQVLKSLKKTTFISHTSIVFPFLFGVLLAYFIYDKYAHETTPFLPFSLFIGISMSITAFPVLARIIQEKGLTRTHLGAITLSSAANGDITAWCLLAVVISIAQAGSMLSAVFNILFSALYLLFMFIVARPFMQMVGQLYHNEEVIDKKLVAFIFLMLVFSSLVTEILGLHALFGAFLAGVIMPADIKFRQIMSEKVEAVSLSLFLPLFFVATGLKTEIGLLNTPDLWLLSGVFILAAVVGKFGGATIAVRLTGESRENSLYIGALMNTRGLMELVVLSIGYKMHILSPPVFVMLVLMTLVTTFMTTPMLMLIRSAFKVGKKRSERKADLLRETSFRVLLSFGRAGSGQVMLGVAHQMFSRIGKKLSVTALHFTVGSEINPLQTGSFESVSFNPILQEAERLQISIEPRYEVSNDVGQDVADIANSGEFDFLLVGAGITWSNLPNDIAANRYRNATHHRYLQAEKWFLPTELLKDKTKMFIEKSHCPVGVFVNRDFVKARKIVLIVDSEADLFLLPYAQTLVKATHGSVSVVYRNSGYGRIEKPLLQFLATTKPSTLLPDTDISGTLLVQYDFMLISYTAWNDVSEHRKGALQEMPSTLILSEPVRHID